jgi:large subunit ribosomal protein L6
MSRIGKAPIAVPAGVTVDIKEGLVFVKGPKGSLQTAIRPELTVKQADGNLLVTVNNDERSTRGLHGLSRTLIANMVKGVTTGFDRNLEIIGVGYRAVMEGKRLILSLGYSHPVNIDPPEGVTIVVGKGNIVTVSGADKQAVGDVSALIRSKRPPEVYKGKGVKYQGEFIRRKAGKAAGKKK